MENAEKFSFDGLGINPNIMAVLTKLEYTVPTPIQHQAIPSAIEGKDVVGIAQTGTGKTLAFGIPMIQRLEHSDGIGLVIAPTRELAIQIDQVLQKIGRSLGLLTAVLIGGEAMGRQVGALRRGPHVVVATPGRLIDHLQQRTLTLKCVSILVLDEADRMFDMGFAPQIERILMDVPADRQTLLFSATMPPAIMKIATTLMKLPLRIEVAPPGTVTENVEQEIIFLRKDSKPIVLNKLLNENRGSVLVFCRTKHGAKKVNESLRLIGIKSAEIHSNRSLAQRREALEGFKKGRYSVLVATDIAARGIDVEGIELVINYDLPENPEDYVHRIGRTGRAGLEGKAVSFATPDQGRDVQMIERIIKKELNIKYTDDAVSRDVATAMTRPPRYRGGRSGGGARRGNFGGRTRRDNRK